MARVKSKKPLPTYSVEVGHIVCVVRQAMSGTGIERGVRTYSCRLAYAERLDKEGDTIAYRYVGKGKPEVKRLKPPGRNSSKYSHILHISRQDWAEGFVKLVKKYRYDDERLDFANEQELRELILETAGVPYDEQGLPVEKKPKKPKTKKKTKPEETSKPKRRRIKS